MSANDAFERSIGERLMAARLQRRVSLMALASNLGLTYQQIRKYESGQNRISASTLFKVAKLLNVDIGYFFSGHGEAKLETREMAVPSDANVALALGRIEDEKARRRIAELIDAIEALDRPQ